MECDGPAMVTGIYDNFRLGEFLERNHILNRALNAHILDLKRQRKLIHPVRVHKMEALRYFFFYFAA